MLLLYDFIVFTLVFRQELPASCFFNPTIKNTNKIIFLWINADLAILNLQHFLSLFTELKGFLDEALFGRSPSHF